MFKTKFELDESIALYKARLVAKEYHNKLVPIALIHCLVIKRMAFRLVLYIAVTCHLSL